MKKTSKKKNKTYTAKLKKKLYLNDKQLKFAVIFLIVFLILVISATYAYFAITSVNNATATTITGTGEELGTPTLTTNTSSLSLNLSAEMMNKATADSSYGVYKIFATPDGKAKSLNAAELLLNGVLSSNEQLRMYTKNNFSYPLATATLDKGVPLDCTYKYDISATVTKTITDDSDYDVEILIFDGAGNITADYTLNELLAGSVTYQGTINFLQPNVDQKVYVAIVVQNTSNKQNDLSGNTFTINITPKSGTDGFSCKTSSPITATSMVEKASSFGLYNSGFEADGYRYIGLNENYAEEATSETGLTSIMNYINLQIENGKMTETEVKNELNVDSLDKNSLKEKINLELDKLDMYSRNNVCFGTTNKTECLNNPDKYMYQIIGVFQEENGDGTINSNSSYHLKLKKQASILYNVSTGTVESRLNTLLGKINDDLFLTNNKYSYMQDSKWLNKIIDWKWTITDSQYDNGGFRYTSDNSETVYLHEMNRNSKTTTAGRWNIIENKIGLIFTSDFFIPNEYMKNIISNNLLLEFVRIAVGLDSLNYNSSNQAIAMSFDGENHVYQLNKAVKNQEVNIGVYSWNIDKEYSTYILPTFYLTSDVVLTGAGTLTDPYMIKQ